MRLEAPVPHRLCRAASFATLHGDSAECLTRVWKTEQRSRNRKNLLGRIPADWDQLRRKDTLQIQALSSHELRSRSELKGQSELSPSLHLGLHIGRRRSVASSLTRPLPCLCCHDGHTLRKKFFSEVEFVTAARPATNSESHRPGPFNSYFFCLPDRGENHLPLGVIQRSSRDN